jgi:hypothetical protein
VNQLNVAFMWVLPGEFDAPSLVEHIGFQLNWDEKTSPCLKIIYLRTELPQLRHGKMLWLDGLGIKASSCAKPCSTRFTLVRNNTLALILSLAREVQDKHIYSEQYIKIVSTAI